MPLTAPCANDASVPQFTTPQLENPLTPQVSPCVRLWNSCFHTTPPPPR